MQLTVWTYEGPPHIGAMRVATGMTGLHYVLHAPQGDTYADLLFTMIERRDARPPVTYTTFQARDLGGDTAELFKTATREAYERFKPQAMIVGASCTAELIQDDPGGLAAALNLPIPVIALELPAYQKKENWGAAETFYRLVRTLAGPRRVGVGETLTIAGFGVTADGTANGLGISRMAALAVTGKPGSLQIRLFDPATRNQLQGLGACVGDSGAPAFDGDKVTGVVSWSTAPNDEEGCGGLTGVTPLLIYRGWIVETARKFNSSIVP